MITDSDWVYIVWSVTDLTSRQDLATKYSETPLIAAGQGRLNSSTMEPPPLFQTLTRSPSFLCQLERLNKIVGVGVGNLLLRGLGPSRRQVCVCKPNTHIENIVRRECRCPLAAHDSLYEEKVRPTRYVDSRGVRKKSSF